MSCISFRNEESMERSIDAVRAAMRGYAIEEKNWSALEPKWKPLEGKIVLGGSTEYRIKPQPQFKPWTYETLPKLPFEIVNKETKTRTTILACKKGDRACTGLTAHFSLSQIFDQFTLPDGSPCGEPA